MSSVYLVACPVGTGMELLKYGKFDRKLIQRLQDAGSASGLLSILEEFQGTSFFVTDNVYFSFLMSLEVGIMADFQEIFNSLFKFIVSKDKTMIYITGSLFAWKLAIKVAKDCDLGIQDIFQQVKTQLLGVGINGS